MMRTMAHQKLYVQLAWGNIHTKLRLLFGHFLCTLKIHPQFNDPENVSHILRLSTPGVVFRLSLLIQSYSAN
jgi:hypothetical protein